MLQTHNILSLNNLDNSSMHVDYMPEVDLLIKISPRKQLCYGACMIG